MKYRAVIQLTGVDGDHVGLYGIVDDAPLRIAGHCQEHFDEAFNLARVAEAQEFFESGDNINPQEYADELLEKKGIHRIFADEAYTDLI